jgi:DNA (cytosine-5)-methyltransferase 1
MNPKNDLAWRLTDLAKIEKRGVRVMSTFACGGGSSMGYKLAGCDIVAANDIDPDMEHHYKWNLHPPLFYRCPIQDLASMPLPGELEDLDILDGSPPCSTFSTIGLREYDWGREKKFREGQAVQVLSDLFFDWLALVNRLRPKVAIAENVKGMLLGRARGYAKLVMDNLRAMGYRPQCFLLNAADCGVPQTRERVFFCALREDIERPKLSIAPRAKWVTASQALADLGNITADEREATAFTEHMHFWWSRTKPGKHFGTAKKAAGLRETQFSSYRLAGNKPCMTIASGGTYCHWSERRQLTFREIKRLGSFPDDYQARSERIGKYMVGMSVPPRLTKAVADAVVEQWLRR